MEIVNASHLKRHPFCEAFGDVNMIYVNAKCLMRPRNKFGAASQKDTANSLVYARKKPIIAQNNVSIKKTNCYLVSFRENFD